MSILGFITEYNPFHYGHKYHLDQSKQITSANFTIAIMSGSFLQRGEPALVDKWTRAKMAIDNGVDLVLELPFIFSSQSAEFFAYGGVKLLNELNIVDYISFGSESGDLGPLSTMATILSKEPEDYTRLLKANLNMGLSYPMSRSKALCQYINKHFPDCKDNYKKIIGSSNNILAIEYLKALFKLDSKIQPIPIKRSGADYNDINLGKGFASATAIRHRIKTRGLNSSKTLMPMESYDATSHFFKEHGRFNYMENYNDIFLYLLRTIDEYRLQSLMGMETGLENRIVQMASKDNNILHIINKIVTKRYPRSRIQRLLIHLLHELYQEEFANLYDAYPSYIRVLGSNKKGFILLNKIKEHSNLPIITKFADYKKYNSKALEDIIYYDKKATDIFFLGVNQSLFNMDYYISPYIK